MSMTLSTRLKGFRDLLNTGSFLFYNQNYNNEEIKNKKSLLILHVFTLPHMK